MHLQFQKMQTCFPTIGNLNFTSSNLEVLKHWYVRIAQEVCQIQKTIALVLTLQQVDFWTAWPFHEK